MWGSKVLTEVLSDPRDQQIAERYRKQLVEGSHGVNVSEAAV
jgi:hypothetical protein